VLEFGLRVTLEDERKCLKMRSGEVPARQELYLLYGLLQTVGTELAAMGSMAFEIDTRGKEVMAGGEESADN
jgi:hypothetical protein